MKTVYIFFFAMLLLRQISAQHKLRENFPHSAITVQYAGSIGFGAIGFSKVSKRNKVELGILAGMLPRSMGGPVQTLSFKFTYNPCQFKLLDKIQFEPLQTGLFLTQNFGENMALMWGKEYPKGYYWWPRSLRSHLFVGSQLSLKTNSPFIDRIACYIEANTNDLYVYSYFSNTRALKLYDIFFLGAGIKVYITR